MKEILKTIIDNLTNWVEVYFWVPVSFMSIYVLSLTAYWLSGRAPVMNMDWMPELGVNLFKCICAIVLTSVIKQALWGWMPMKDKLENSCYALARQVLEVVVFLSFLWVLFNK